MKIAITSDIHLDHYYTEVELKLFSNCFPSADLLILAGDLVTSFPQDQGKLTYFVNQIFHKYENIVAVPGNHDFYNAKSTNHSSDFVFSDDRLLTLNKSIFCPKTGPSSLYKIAGCFAWYHPVHPMMTDINQIKDVQTLSFEQQKADFDWLGSLPSKGEIDILVTHVPLIPQLANPKYAARVKENKNFFFNRPDIIKKIAPKLYISGHTHYRNQLTLEDTLCITHAAGYRKNLPINFRPVLVEL